MGRVNLALFSENTTSVELCLFDGPDATRESQRIRLAERTNQIWHISICRRGAPASITAAVSMGPAAGHRVNPAKPAKLLIDPYAKSIAGTILLSDRMFAYRIREPDEDLMKDERDKADETPKCVVGD